MKSIDEIAAVSPIRQSLPSEGTMLEALERCYDHCGGIESLDTFEQHEVLVRSQKAIHNHTRDNLAANVAYSLLFQYHAQLLETHFEELIADQAASQKSHERNDPLWRPKIGWVFVEKMESSNVIIRPWQPRKLLSTTDTKRVKASGFYVNLRLALDSPPITVPALP